LSSAGRLHVNALWSQIEIFDTDCTWNVACDKQVFATAAHLPLGQSF